MPNPLIDQMEAQESLRMSTVDRSFVLSPVAVSAHELELIDMPTVEEEFTFTEGFILDSSTYGVLDTSALDATSESYTINKITCPNDIFNFFGTTKEQELFVANSLLVDLEAYYAFDGDVFDSSGNAMNGSLTGGTYLTVGQKGGTGALSFDGSGDYVTFPYFSIFDSAEAYSLSVWVLMDTTAARVISTTRLLDGTGNQANVLEWGSSKFAWSQYKTGGSSIIATTTSTFSTGVWYHIVATFDGTYARIYVNGVLEGTSSAISGSPQTITASTPFRIGRYTSVATSVDMLGDVDEVGIWSRALSLNEISRLYNSGSGLFYSFSASIVADESAQTITFSAGESIFLRCYKDTYTIIAGKVTIDPVVFDVYSNYSFALSANGGTSYSAVTNNQTYTFAPADQGTDLRLRITATAAGTMTLRRSNGLHYPIQVRYTKQ